MEGLLLKWVVARILAWQSLLVPDSDVRIDHGVLGCDGDHSIRIVRLWDPVQLETSGPGLVVLVAHSVMFFVASEEILAEGLRVRLASDYFNLVVTLTLILELLQLLDLVPVAIGLTIVVFVHFCSNRRLHECPIAHVGNWRLALSSSIRLRRLRHRRQSETLLGR